MAETKWRVIAGHVRRRVLEWKCETKGRARWRPRTLKWCRPFQNSTSRLRPCLSPTAHNYCRQPSKSGDAWMKTLFMRNSIAAGQRRFFYVHLYTGFTPSLSFIPPIFNANFEGLKTTDIMLNHTATPACGYCMI